VSLKLPQLLRASTTCTGIALPYVLVLGFLGFRKSIVWYSFQSSSRRNYGYTTVGII
jgi:hypothetical protein